MDVILSVLASAGFYLGALLIVIKAGEYDGAVSFLISPINLYYIIFGSRLYFIIPVILIISYYLFSPWLSIALLIWHIIYSISLAKAFGMSILAGIIFIFFPILSMLYVGLFKEYEGEVDLLFFLG